jgi:hypothetical protein
MPKPRRTSIDPFGATSLFPNFRSPSDYRGPGELVKICSRSVAPLGLWWDISNPEYRLGPHSFLNVFHLA